VGRRGQSDNELLNGKHLISGLTPSALKRAITSTRMAIVLEDSTNANFNCRT